MARREPLNAKTSPRDSSKGQKTPSPHTMFHTPLGTARRVALYYFVVLKRRKCIRGLFLGVFGIRGGPLKGSPRLHKGIRRPRVRCAHVVGHVKVLGQSFPSKTPNGKKHSFFLPMKRAHRSSNPLGQGAPTTLRSSPTTYDPSRSPTLLVEERSYEPHRPTLQTRLSAQREAVGESWKRQTCKRHIKDKTLEETRCPET